MYFETDPHMSDELILAFGKKLRTDFYENIHTFVDSIPLMDKEELYEMHSDFCSRLGMTFSHGDYCKIDVVKEKDKTAEKLYKRSLSYHPNHRAYLGLGILKQKNKAYKESIKNLSEGIEFFPESEDLNLCLGISYMSLRDYNRAISYFSKFPEAKQANYHLARCYNELGDSEKEAAFLEKFEILDKGP